MLFMRNIPIGVPEEVAHAVRAEALRQCRRPAEVLSDWLRNTFPTYVANAMQKDFARSLPRFVEVEATSRIVERKDGAVTSESSP